jgi:hypothetical protein
MTQDELKLVLEALKWCHGGEPCGTAEAIAVVEKALAQRTWVGLTDVEIDYLLVSTAGENEETHISFARAIEAKLKELNDHGI